MNIQRTVPGIFRVTAGRLVLAVLLAMLSSASWAGLRCAGPGWPTTVSYAPGVNRGEGILSFGENIIPIDVQRVESFSIIGNRIKTVVYVFDTCGIGIPPPPDLMRMPSPEISPGEYLVDITVLGTSSSVPFTTLNLPLTVTGPAGSANGIPALSPSQLLALIGVLLAMGMVAIRRRVFLNHA